jgi:hypothetical protein
MQVRRARREAELMREDVEGRERRMDAKEARQKATETELAEAEARASR